MYQTGMKFLRFEENNLTTLPTNFFESFEESLYLHIEDNPWNCDCNFLKMIRINWNKLAYKITCNDGKEVYETADNDNCQ